MPEPQNKTTREGGRIEVPAIGKIFQWLAAGVGLRALIRAVNALINLEVTVDPKATIPAFIVSDTNAKLLLPGSIINGARGTGGTGTASIAQFKIVSDGGDYWNCNTFDGTTLGSTIVKVAKPYKLRAVNGPHSELIRGVTYTYTYAAVTVSGVTGYYTRAVSGSDGSSETDFMIPDPIANDIIYGVTFSTLSPATLSAVIWLDVNADGRAWAT